MVSFGKDMLVGSFVKNGYVYHVILAKDSLNDDENLIYNGMFKGIFLHPFKKNICEFYISLDEEGRWIPDKTNFIEPWMADHIGEIIENHLV